MRRGSKKTIQAALVGTVAAIAATETMAQNLTSAMTGGLTFSTSMSADTNPTLSATSAGSVFDISENLAFSFSSQASSQTFSFNGDTGVAFSNSASGSSQSFTKPRVNFGYFRDGANSNLDVSASYWNKDVITSFDSDPSAATAIIVDTGTLNTVSGAVIGNWGLNAPLGFTANLSYDNNDYVGTTNPALFDSTTIAVGVTAHARLSPTTQGDFSVTRTTYDSQDSFNTNSRAMDYVFSGSHDVNGTLTLNGSLGFQQKSKTASGATVVFNGFYGSAGLNQALPDGSAFATLNFDQTDGKNGAALTVGRSMDFPTGTLSASLTADWESTRGSQILGAAAYSQQLADGSISVDFSQSLTTDSLNQDIRYSNLGVGYQRTVNSVSAIDLSLNLSRSEDGGAGAAPTLDRSTLAASYTRQLNSDWNMSVGYQHRAYSGSAVSSVDSDSVFLTITKDLQFGF